MFTVCESNRFKLDKDGYSGTGQLVRLSDNLSTPLFTGSEGEEDMRELELLCVNYGNNRFDYYCEEYFQKGSTVYDAQGNIGFINQQGNFEGLNND